MKISLFSDLHMSAKHNLEDVTESLARSGLKDKGFSSYEAVRDYYYEEYFKTLFEQEADIYVSLGDLTNMGEREEYDLVFNLIKAHGQDKRFINLIGNHDTYVQSKEEVINNYKIERYGSFTKDGICIIYLDSTRDQNMADWSGVIDDEQLAWLEETLTTTQDNTLVVLSHHPVYGTTDASTDEKASIEPDNRIKEILENYQGKGYFFNGHTHVESIVEIGNWHYIQVGSVMDQSLIRNIEIDSEGIEINTVGLEDGYKEVGLWLGGVLDHYEYNVRNFNGEENRILMQRKIEQKL